MKARKRLNWTLGIALLAMLAVVVAQLTGFRIWPDPINPSRYGQIQLGMSQAEVEGIIGLPPGLYYSVPSGIGGPYLGPLYLNIASSGVPEDKLDPDMKGQSWLGDSYGIGVVFDNEGKAVAIFLDEAIGEDDPRLIRSTRSVGPPPTVFDRILAWLGL